MQREKSSWNEKNTTLATMVVGEEDEEEDGGTHMVEGEEGDRATGEGEVTMGNALHVGSHPTTMETSTLACIEACFRQATCFSTNAPSSERKST